jgi:dipeptidyl aminopeptidase/acylaminoacyl peptidase
LAFIAARDEDLERKVGRPDRGDGDVDGDGDAANSDDNGDDDEPKSQVWVFDLALGGDARQLTDREEGVSQFDWSPDGERLVVAARDPTDDEREYLAERRDGGPIVTERLQHKADGAGWLDSVATYLFVVDAETGEETRLDEAYGGGASEVFAGMGPAWGPDGRIAFTSCRLERPDDTYVRDLYTIRSDGSDLTKLTDSDLAIDGPRWSPDGERIAFVGRGPENHCAPSEVYVHDGEEYRSLMPDLDRTLGWYAEPVWADDETLYTLVGDESRTRLVRLRVDGPPERVFEAQGDDRGLKRFDLAGDTAALHLSHPTEGSDVFAVAAADLDAESEPDSLVRLSNLNRTLAEEYSMPEVRRVSFENGVSERGSDARETESSGGWNIDGVVYHDPDVDLDDGPHPLVLAIHGGPVSYDEPEFNFDHAALTSRGYVILRVNYRGGSSYGRAFAETLKGRWGTVEVDDLVAGVEHVVGRGWADPDRVFGFGFSYGGIAQGYLVTQTDVLAAAVPEHGIYDLRSLFGTDDCHVWTEHEFGLPWEDPEAFDASSSILDVENISAPLLVTAGGQDWRCPPSQSEQLYVAAKKLGVDAKLVVYPDEHHNIGDPKRAVHRLEQITEWYERHDPARQEDGDAPSGDEN